MRCPRDADTLAEMSFGVTMAVQCPTCRGVWGDMAALEALTQGPVVTRATSVSLGAHGDATGAIPCPGCARPLGVEESRKAMGHEVLVCRACRSAWLDARTLVALRAAHLTARGGGTESRATQGLASVPPDEQIGAPRDLGHVPSDPATVFSSRPEVELAALPLMLALAWGVTATGLGELLAFLPRIQFHELGHALVAWSTGRSALPLPCGLTFWSFERSTILVAAEVLLPILLAIHGARTRNPLAVVAAAVGVLAVAVGLWTPLEASESWLVAGGGVGEIVLPALAAAAFHLPLPAKLRWDFWRWLVMAVALFALASVARSWWEIEAGTRPLPFGSFLSGRDSGDGDLDRLIRDHGWTEAGLRSFYGGLARTAFVGLVALHLAVEGGRIVGARIGPMIARARRGAD